MFYSLSRSILLTNIVAVPPTHKLHRLPKHPAKQLSVRRISNNPKQHSFAVSYLVNSCGLSLESALWASKYVHFETPEKPDSVLRFFKDHGFSETQISIFISRSPGLLSSNPEKTLLPKLEFFYSKGFSNPDLAKILCDQPSILKRSLETQIIPYFNFLKDLLKSDESAIAAIKHYPRMLLYDLETHMIHHVNILRESGVPESSITVFLRNQPRVFLANSYMFKEILEKVKRMGFDPLKTNFLSAVLVLGSMSKSTWGRKVHVYKKWNWSEKEIFEAFRKNPWCMMASEDKIMAIMDYFVCRLGCESSFMAKRPAIILLSLKKRIVPRGEVAQVLLSKGLIRHLSLSTLFQTSENLFLNKFVDCYKEEAPQLLKLYQEKLDLSR